MKSFITTLTFTLSLIFGFSQNSEYTKLDSFLTVLEENDRFFGSVAVAQKGSIIYSKAIGFADVENNKHNNNETKFRIGSVSKTYTATLAMKAVEMGKINLDDAIDKYFPIIQNASTITVRHLLNHRSGINTFTDREYLSWYTKPITRTALLDKIIAKGIDFEPDTEYSYSNSNYVLLSMILEDIFETSFAQILENYISKPLDLANTAYGAKINTSNNEAKSFRKKSSWVAEEEGHMSIPLGAGGIISTAEEMCLFGEALFNGKIISSAYVEQMKPNSKHSYGFALEGIQVDDAKGIGHTGVIDAFSSILSYFEKEDLCIAVICNGSNFGIHDVAVAALNEVLGKSYEIPTFEFIELASSELDQYLGTYENEELPIDLVFTKEGNQLIATGTGQAPILLKAEGNHQFSCLEFGLKLLFNPEERKLQLKQGGMEFVMTIGKNAGTKVQIESKIENIEQYLGTYSSDQLPMDLVIGRDGNRLTGQGAGQAVFPLSHDGNHVFSNKAIGLRITFRSEEKKMSLEQGGALFEMTMESE